MKKLMLITALLAALAGAASAQIVNDTCQGAYQPNSGYACQVLISYPSCNDNCYPGPLYCFFNGFNTNVVAYTCVDTWNATNPYVFNCYVEACNWGGLFGKNNVPQTKIETLKANLQKRRTERAGRSSRA